MKNRRSRTSLNLHLTRRDYNLSECVVVFVLFTFTIHTCDVCVARMEYIWSWCQKFYFLSHLTPCLMYLYVSRKLNIKFKNNFDDVNNRKYLIKIRFSFNLAECGTCMCRRRRRCRRQFFSNLLFFRCYANEQINKKL